MSSYLIAILLYQKFIGLSKDNNLQNRTKEQRLVDIRKPYNNNKTRICVTSQ